MEAKHARCAGKGCALLIVAITVAAGATGVTSDARQHRTLTAGIGNGPGVTNHPVGVVPSGNISIPAGWPLDASGAITCWTCHVSLTAGKGRFAPQLRDMQGSAVGGTEFCAHCHTTNRPRHASAIHWLALERAHIQSDRGSSAGSVGRVDGESRRCLGCHDGVTASQSFNGVSHYGAMASFTDPKNSHPIGVPYPPRSRDAASSSYNPRMLVPDRVRLPGGLVSCVSCHDLYAPQQDFLTMPTERSALCFACHDM